jgi:hypothetical protein
MQRRRIRQQISAAAAVIRRSLVELMFAHSAQVIAARLKKGC